ncbi:UNKNOWN [Stylonychia lemnae]|uniref:Uncharacterized protein n=1 Tax=Stylonychia lemnae TaxID=5949 RepID=A0A078AUA3_STYLE|nr:UNKNOWN [Stylonychia lemnae]|eukprot:CDW85985.1 UNKNOWN [Stylonychia lemnae]
MNLHLTNLWIFYYPIYLLGVYYSSVIAFWVTLVMGFIGSEWITLYQTNYTKYFDMIITNFLA